MVTRRRAVEKRPRRGVRQRAPKKRRRSKMEDRFAALIEYQGWPTAEREVRFHKAGVIYPKSRLFRFDFFFRDYNVAVELDGGTFRPNTGHTSAQGLAQDHTKDVLAQMQDIFIIRLTEIAFREGDAERWVEAALTKKGWVRPDETETTDA